MPISSTPIKKDSVLKPTSEKKSHEKDYEYISPIYSFQDMVITEELLNSIKDAVAVFEYKELLFNKWALETVLKKPTSVCMNFYGEPGTGKTMAAHAVAKMLNMNILQVNYAEIESKYVGETSKNLSKLFEQALRDNVLVLFDEADALLSRRVTDMNSATDVSVNQTRSVLLNLLDTFEGVIVFTTNFISNYDPAFLRRIPYHINFELPNKELRIKLLQHYLDNTVPNDVNYHYIAETYEGITGNDIAIALFRSALYIARNSLEMVTTSDFERYLKEIVKSKMANSKKEDRIVSVTEREVTEEYALSQMKRRNS